MLNFAEQTGSGAVIVVWSLLPAPLRWSVTCIVFYAPLSSFVGLLVVDITLLCFFDNED